MNFIRLYLIITMVSSVVTLVLGCLNEIGKRKIFNGKIDIELNSKVRLQWIEDVRKLTATMALDYRTMAYNNGLEGRQNKREETYAAFLHDIYLLGLYFVDCEQIFPCDLDIAKECEVKYYKDPNKQDTKVKKLEKIEEYNKQQLIPLVNQKSNRGKSAIINELLKHFGEIVSSIEIRQKDDPNSKYLKSVH